ncbi:DNA polymerase II [Lacimicrobium alkaliphilum]|uniref:DNA polymerase n=1 Tax=Lacimicrobium alkaliphilum TaxID=1526571 RepID=A0A0U2ZB73_9ALTE|nr:DNA polymerase II [Lacimicrobium alkaliphilum]ALS99748.1 DNA polymerase II [Lacimicrobium alkaliphilum]
MLQQGFVLTRQIVETDGKSCLVLWLNTVDGPVKLITEPQESCFFIQQTDSPQAARILSAQGIEHQLRELELRTFDQQPVTALYFASPAQAYQVRDLLKGRGIVCYEDDIRLANRYLMERFVCGSLCFSGNIRQQSGYVLVEQARVKRADYQPTFRSLSLDIECSGRGQLYSVGLSAQDHRAVIMIGEPESGPDWIYWVADEKALLQALITQVQQYDPDLFIGWNLVNFDFKLLIERAGRLGLPLLLGRGNSAVSWRDGRETNQGFVTVPGRVVIDGIDGLKTATYQFDSFSLEHVSQELLGKGKATEDVDNRLAAIEHDFQHNKVKLAEYNLQDCVLVEEIFSHTRLLDFLTLRSRLTGLELDRSGGSVAAFTNLYLPRLHRAGYIAPNLPADGGLASPGGYVMESRPGLYKQVLVLDFKSLYPSIIRTFKIDPMGLTEGLLEPEKAIPGFRDAVFHRSRHFLPDIIASLWAQRDEAKQQQDAARSQAIKILMNSFYGVLGSGGCRFYDTRLASSITLRGHDIMQTTARWIEEQGHQVIYGDTDSTFVWLGDEVTDEQAAEQGRKLEQMINQRWQQKLRDELELECFLEIEFESHFKRFVMPTIRGSEQGSKKRYAGLKATDKGDKLVFKGLESVRSDWTALARHFQTRLYEMVFADKDVLAFIRQLIEQVKAGELDEQLVYRKRLRKPLTSYVKNIPPHVRAARLADEQNKALGKPLRYQHKGWIHYVITLNGPQPLEYQNAPLDYEHYIERQIRPVAEGILPFVGENFDTLVSQQMGLFG